MGAETSSGCPRREGHTSRDAGGSSSWREAATEPCEPVCGAWGQQPHEPEGGAQPLSARLRSPGLPDPLHCSSLPIPDLLAPSKQKKE